MTKVAIIGAGIVGATAAYYLSKEKDFTVTVFDDGKGQATKAAAGIICPWFSRRRNKAWYKMARLGADFYQTLIADLAKDGVSTAFYQQTGAYVLKKNAEHFQDLYALAKGRLAESPLIGELGLLDQSEVAKTFPHLHMPTEQLLFASGAAKIDGKQMVEELLKAASCPVISQKVDLKKTALGYEVSGKLFDQVILASGAWLPELLAPLGYDVDVRPQKGQLQDYQLEEHHTKDYPVVIPEGEIDLIPFSEGHLVIGASHENDQGYNIQEDPQVLSALKEAATYHYPPLKKARHLKNRVGIRAYTSDHTPFYGEVPNLAQVYAVSGLGSSGLTTGPLIAKEVVSLITRQEQILDIADYPVTNYIRQKEVYR